MRSDGNERDPNGKSLPREATHVVFDFEGLRRPDFADLSLILTARLQAAPGDRVWARALPPQTARLLRVLGLGHLFRPFRTSATTH